MENVNKRGNALVGALIAILIIAAVLFGMFLANYLQGKKEEPVKKIQTTENQENNSDVKIEEQQKVNEQKNEKEEKHDNKQNQEEKNEKEEVEEQREADILMESFTIIGTDNKEYKANYRKKITPNYEKKYYEIYNASGKKLTYTFDNETYDNFIVFLSGAGYGYIDEAKQQEAFYGYGDNSTILTKIVGNKIYSIIGNRKRDNNKVYEYEITINNDNLVLNMINDYSNIIIPVGMVR